MNRKERRARRARDQPGTGGAEPPAADVETAMLAGLGHHRAGRTAEAAAIYRRVLAARPGHADALHLLGLLAHQAGDHRGAIRLIGQAIARDPSYPVFHLNLGAALLAEGRAAEAEAAFRRALALDPAYPEAISNLGNALAEQGQTEAAIAAYRRALALRPDYPKALVNLAGALLDAGEIGEAEACARRALALQPDSLAALVTLGGVVRFAPGDALAGAVEAAWRRTDLGEGERIDLAYLIGKMHADLGAHARAFAAFAEANRLARARARRQGRAFDRDGYARFVGRLIATFGPAFLAERAGFGAPSERPVFIVGMPRSGTTLVEQMLASHPAVHGGGELGLIEEVVSAFPAETGLAFPEGLPALDRAGAARLAERVLARLAALSPLALRITDKTPLNFQYLGLIALLLPGARVVHCRRDPRDTCLSCHFQNFDPRQGLAFVHDLGDLGAFHRQYRRLMDHWRATLPLPMLEVGYEALLAEPEAVARQMVAFLGLDWDERCLAFHRTRRVVRSASRVQVRRPLDPSARGRWRAYEAHLAPLLAALAEEGEAEGG